MASSSDEDSDDSGSSTGTSKSTTSTASQGSQASSVRASGRSRRKRRNDDSLAEELDAKCRKLSKQKKTTRKPKENKVKEHGVKPSQKSHLERTAAMHEVKRLKKMKEDADKLALKSHKGKNKSADIKSSATPESSLPKKKKPLSVAQDSQQATPSSIPGSSSDTQSIETKDENEWTPRKIKMQATIDELRQKFQVGGEEKDKGLAPPEITMNTTDDGNETLKAPDNDDQFMPENDTSIYQDATMIANVNGDLPTSPTSHAGSGTEENDSDSPPKKSKKKSKKKKSKKKKSKKEKKKSKKKSKKRKSKKKKSRRHSSSSSSSSSSSTSSSEEEEKEAKKRAMLKKRKTLINYELLQYNKPSDELAEIVKGSGIYMNAISLARVMGGASSSHTSAARQLCRGVFKEEALRNCSVMGNPAKGPKGKPEEVRPCLCPVALQAIYTAANDIAIDQDFKIKERREVNLAIGTLQSELRGLYKLAN